MQENVHFELKIIVCSVFAHNRKIRVRDKRERKMGGERETERKRDFQYQG